MNTWSYYPFALLLAALCAAGCGQAGPSTTLVRGTVTFDGEPLHSGSIVFDPVDGQGGSSSGGITNGQFEFESELGSKRVLISAVRQTDERDEYGEPITESIIPAKYNSETTLTADVKSGEENTFNFDLKTDE